MKIRKVLLSCVLVLAVALVCVFALPTTADAATEGDYTYTVSNGEATITGYNGGGGDVTIPSKLGGYPVTTIGEGAFSTCSSLTSITIGDSVTTIGEDAFNGCNSLVSITIPDSVTTIGNSAFSFCDSLTSITIGDSVTTIGDYAFSPCHSLTSVTLGDSVTTIGDYAFEGCYSLTSITIPDSVTTIGDYAFFDCYSLTSVTIGDSVTSIGNYAFYFCDSLESVTIPDSVTTLGRSVFSGCHNLESVTIGDGVTTLDPSSFFDCSSLTSVIIGDGVTALESGFFNFCENLTDITIGNGVTVIGDALFSDCSKLTNVSLGNGITTIGDYAFYCTNLTEITIPNSVTTIGDYAFFGTNLTEITIPDSVTTLGDEVFSDCSNLTSITIGNGVVATIGEGWFRGSTNLTDVIIGDGITAIAQNAFSGCTSLKNITIGKGVTFIDEGAFYNCASLVSITVPNSVTEISGHVFYGCSNLTSVIIGDKLSKISTGAFEGCNSLADVYFVNGSITLRDNIDIGEDNYLFTNATWHYIQCDDHIYSNDCDSECDVCGTPRVVSHNFIPATCTAPKSCKDCGATSGSALGHSYTNTCDTDCNICSATRIISHNYAAATCTKPAECTVCGETTGEPLGHDYAGTTCTEPATCRVCKVTTGTALGHDYTSATCTEPKTCKRCSATEGVALGHDYAAATCTTPKTCKRCSATVGTALGHDYAEATCTTPKTCKVCSVTEGAALGHDYAAATCIEPKTCKVCSATEGEALGHDYADATCTEPKTCKRCSATEGEALGHDYAAATCTEPKTCKRCDATDGSSLGHAYDNVCDTVCNRCSEGRTVEHIYSTVYTADGENHWYQCVVCGNKKSVEPHVYDNACDTACNICAAIRSITHDYANATCITPKTCKVCSATEGAALGHDYADATCTAPKTCKVCGATEGTALGHKFGTLKHNEDEHWYPCLVCGHKDSLQPHNYSDVHDTTCNTCGTIRGVFIFKQPQSVSVADGKTATVSVSATGEGLKYQWYYSWEGEFLKCSGTGKSSYSIAMNESRAGRQMYCVITDKYGNKVQTETVTLGMKITITKQPVSVNALNGKTVSFSVAATGAGLKYQWYYSWEGEFLACSGTGKSSYSITMNKDRAGRQMYCVITDKFGNSVQTNTVTMYIGAMITQQPKTVPVKNGEKATISLTAIGEGLKYQWYYKYNGKFVKSSDVGQPTYSITMNKDRAGRQMYCVITDKFGNSVKSSTVTLGMAVSISKQPVSVTVANGKTATVSVSATGEGLKYQWYYSWEGEFLKCSGTGKSSYSIAMTESRAGRQMYCVITDKYGNKVQTDTVTLGMTFAITKQPTSTSAALGKSAKVSVTATGAGLKYQWYYSWEGEFLACSGTGKSSYSITMTEERAGRQMYCVITDKFGNSIQSNTVTLHKGPTITQQPKSVQVKNGAKATIGLTATGEGLKYQWYYKYNGKFVKSTDVGKATYSITMNKDRAGRQMYCIITDKFGTSVKSDVVTLGMAVSISTQPKTVTVAKGKTAKISVTATGDGLKYQWYYSWKGEFLKCSGTGKSSYSITMSKDRAGRQMYCVITDKYGNQVQTNTVTLKMK